MRAHCHFIFPHNLPRRLAKLLLGVVAWTLCAASQASPEMVFRTLGIKDGLSQSSALAIHQDRYGFIWIGTYDGLNRYDGRNFITFKPDGNGNKSIMGGTIYSIAEDNDGLLYFGTYGQGLNVFNPRSATFEYYRDTDSLPNGTIPSNYINAMHKGPDGNIWIACRAGVSVFNPKSRTFTNYLSAHKQFPQFSATDIFFEGDSHIWAATNGGGLALFDAAAKRFVSMPLNKLSGDMHKNNNINKIALSPNGNSLLLATRGGVFAFDLHDLQYQQFANITYNASSIYVDSKKNVWVGSMENPLQYISPDQRIQVIEANKANPKCLPESFVEVIFEDNTGNLWLGLKSNGVAVSNSNIKPFTHLFNNDTNNCIPGNEVYAIEEAPNGDIWIGTMSGMARWNRQSNTFKQYTPQNSKLPNGQIWDLKCQGNDTVWIAGSEGLYMFVPKTSKVKAFFHNPNDSSSLISNEITTLAFDPKGRLWVGTSQGLSRFDARTGKFRNNFKCHGRLLTNMVIWSLLPDSKGRLWIGTEDGLDLYDLNADTFQTFHFDASKPNTIPHNDITSVRESPDRSIWVSTRSGIGRYNESTKDFLRVESPKFANIFCYSTFEIDGTLWVSSNKGLVKIDRNSNNVKYFVEDDGIQGNEFNPPGIVTTDGYLLFGGINGVTGFFPNQIKIDTQTVPKIYFTRLSIDYDLIETGRDVGNHKVMTQLEFAQKLMLNYDEKLLSIGFSALDYAAPQKINYFYRILPDSKEWIPLNNQNYVTFVNLQPGNYEVQVRSTNADGVEVNNVKSLQLVVLPPFWRTWWFISLLSLLCSLLAIYVIRYRFVKLRHNTLILESQVLERTKKIEIQKRQIEIQRNIANHQRDKIAQQRDELEVLTFHLEEKVKERTKELEQAKTKAEESDKLKSAFLSNMSHEIRTPLNAIIGFSELLLYQDFEQDEKESFAEIIKTNGDHLLHLLNDIIDVSMIEAGQLQLHAKMVDVNALLQDVWLSFKNHRILKDKNGDVDLLLQSPANHVVLFTDALRLKQVLYNLISNAIKFTEQGVVEIECLVISGHVRFSVKDSGIGIAPEHQTHIFERFRKIAGSKRNLYGGFGLGLTISRNLVESLGGKIWVESVKNQGTTFFFTLPINVEPTQQA